MITIALVFILFCAIQIVVGKYTVRVWAPLLIVLAALVLNDFENAQTGILFGILALPLVWIGMWGLSVRKKRVASRQSVRSSSRPRSPVSKSTTENLSKSVEVEVLSPEAISTATDESLGSVTAQNAQRQTNEQRDSNALAALQLEKMDRRLLNDPISAILRPQVPIKFNEPPRSWLGGLPRMPEDVTWPRGGEKNWPMHFAAQICCADLPDQLWQGQGPRQGWILLFMDGFRMGNYDGYDGDHPDGWAYVLHIDNLGPERTPPADIRGVHDLAMSGPDYDDSVDQSDVPTVWRKWPIDIVPQKIEIDISEKKVANFTGERFALKSTTPEELYGVAGDASPIRIDPKEFPPLTWKGVVSFVKLAIKAQRVFSTGSVREKPGFVTERIGSSEQRLKRLMSTQADVNAMLSKTDAELMAEGKQSREMMLERLQLLSASIEKEEITLARLRHYSDPEDQNAWLGAIKANALASQEYWSGQAALLLELLEEVEANDPFTAMTKADWSKVYDTVATMRCQEVQWKRKPDDPWGPTVRAEQELISHSWTESTAREHYLDLYSHSSTTRDLIPKQAQEVLEQIARHVRWGRPHRMGGLAEHEQHSMGPDDPPLLFQIANHDALNWFWGNAAVITIHTTEQELLERKFQVFANY